MSHVQTVSLALPCPTCSVPRALTAAYTTATSADEGSVRAVLHECTRCWRRRALALGEARQRLRREGQLAGSGARMTWRGEMLAPAWREAQPVHSGAAEETDGLTDALLSELLRRDVPAARTARLTLPASIPVEETSRR